MAGGVDGRDEGVDPAGVQPTCRRKKGELGIGRELDTSDFHVEVIDLLEQPRRGRDRRRLLRRGLLGAARSTRSQPALLVLGDMSVQGNIKPVRSLAEPLQVAMDNGAKRALIPIENKRNFLEVTRRHRGARRPDLLRRPEDGGDEGLGRRVNMARQVAQVQSSIRRPL